MRTGYEKNTYQFLSAYRFVSYALAVMFTQVGPQLGTLAISDLEINIILAALGVYSLLRVFSRLRWREGSPMTYVILIGDFLISILLVIYTGGLNSSFLLYSLTPIITAALFFEERMAITLAASASILTLHHSSCPESGELQVCLAHAGIQSHSADGLQPFLLCHSYCALPH